MYSIKTTLYTLRCISYHDLFFFGLNTLKGTTKAPGVDLLDTKTILGSAKHRIVLYRSHSPLPPPLNVIPSLQSTVSSLGTTMTNNF